LSNYISVSGSLRLGLSIGLAAVACAARADFLVVDLSAGPAAKTYPVERLADVPAGGWTDRHKTDLLVLKELPAGSFHMGERKDALGANFANPWYEGDDDVTLTKGFAVGVFEVTQRQWQLVMGESPSRYVGTMRPVESVSYLALRGAKDGVTWPQSDRVDAESFIGRLRQRTDLRFDLPTDAQWEYACRAGTTTQLGTGKDITDVRVCPNVAETARYAFNRTDGRGGFAEHTTVGSYAPNAWGLYDFHGNVAEWCLDRWGNNPRKGRRTDPRGPESGQGWRVVRGGTWHEPSGTGWAAACRSGFRSRSYYYTCYPNVMYPFVGVRLAVNGASGK